MKTKTTFFSMALLIAFSLLGCSNDDGYSSSSPTPKAPLGAKNQYLFPGSTVSQIKVEGANIRWYLNLSQDDVDPFENYDLIEVNNIYPMAILTPDFLVRDNTTYYATQTVNNVQSRSFLAVKVHFLERY